VCQKGAWTRAGEPYTGEVQIMKARALLTLSLLLIAASIVVGTVTGAAASKAASQALPARVDYSRDIRPVISVNCFACHGPDTAARQANLRLDVRAEAVKDRGGVRAITPGNPGASRIYARISAKEPAARMPPPGSGHTLTSHQIQLLRRWIEQDAPYAEHWAFQKPKRPAVPGVGHWSLVVCRFGMSSDVF
jgi:mono/diheme cytochrome c family protein